MLSLQDLTFSYPNQPLLFDQIGLTVANHEKIALTGNNGSGKSTLLKIIAGELKSQNGQVISAAPPYYVPQIFGQFHHLTIAQALKVDEKLQALKEILNGQLTEANFTALNDDWNIEERCREALHHWRLSGLDLSEKMERLSGGQKTRVFLAGILIHQPQLVLLDEPSNHLDVSGRQILYEFISSTKTALVVVSHDRKLLNLLHTVCELSRQELKVYGGNYEFYEEQKQIERDALDHQLQSKEKALRKAREKQRETLERQQKLDNRGKRKHEKEGVAKIMMNTLRNKAENSTSKLKEVHSEKIGGIAQELQELRAALPDLGSMKFGFERSHLHKGKILFKAEDINVNFDQQPLWRDPLKIQVNSGDRIAVKGDNGTGKTTLLKIILGKFDITSGVLSRAENSTVYIDQDYSLINDEMTVYEQAQLFNTALIQEHEIKIRLSRFLFNMDDWDKQCSGLSGGEKMRLLLCCITLAEQSPDIIVLDEPTNNLDLQNVAILTAAVNEYRGTLLVVSHDATFLSEIGITREIEL